MSYSFDMQFEFVPAWQEALNTAADCALIVEQRENIRSLIKENIRFLKYRLGKNTPRPYEVENWVAAISTLRFVFWPEHELLALVGNAWPGLKGAFAKSVYFQNSTDQDYELKEWEGICPYFDNLCIEFERMTPAELAKTGLFGGYTPEELSGNVEYYRRTGMYAQVFKGLQLNDWLYGRNNPAFRRFSMGALQTQEKLLDAATYANALLRKGEYF